MSRWISFLTAVVLLLSVIAVGLLEFLYRWQVAPKLSENRAAQVRVHSAYLEDIAFMEKALIFQSAKQGSSDAGKFLNPMLHWIPEESAGKTAGPLIPADIREQILRLNNNWMQKYVVARHWEKPELKFFSELQSFDYWDIESSSPIEKLSQTEKFVPPTSLPLPDPIDLMIAAKIRLMRGGLYKKPIEALREVRHLARLMITTENMQLVLAGISLLDDERRAYRYFVDQMDLPESAWQPIDRNQTRRAYRSILATRGFLYLWTPHKFTSEIFLSEAKPPGLCAAVNEAFPLEFAIRFMLEPRLPFEADLSKEYRQLDEIIKKAKSQCRLKYLSKLIEKDAFNIAIPGPLFMSHLPYARKVMGLRISAVNFVGFEPYWTMSGQ